VCLCMHALQLKPATGGLWVRVDVPQASQQPHMPPLWMPFAVVLVQHFHIALLCLMVICSRSRLPCLLKWHSGCPVFFLKA